MSDGRLEVVLGGSPVGHVERRSDGRLHFGYEESSRRAPSAIPLSISMPLSATEHGHERIEPFLDGLLPDNDEVRRRWGMDFHVSHRSAFSLLAHVGEDCAGAAQFVRPERLEAVLSDQRWDVTWLTMEAVEARLRKLDQEASAWQERGATGQFSLAGAQSKIALMSEDGRWGLPAGRAPTTHILKPPLRDFPGHIENEHLCLRLARELGLPVAETTVRRFGACVALVVERFDRARPALLAAAAAASAAASSATTALDPAAARAAAEARARAAALSALAERTPILRVHQEDLCQALGVPPGKKYQSEGGPSPADIVDLLRTHSSRPVEDVWTFVEALALNWLIAGTDGHAKNYSLLHGGRGRVRLAPLYDVASLLPYEGRELRRVKLAMKIGDKYPVREIAGRHWEKLAAELRLDPTETRERVRSLVERSPAAMEGVRTEARDAGLEPSVVDRLAELITARAADCARALGEGTP